MKALLWWFWGMARVIVHLGFLLDTKTIIVRRRLVFMCVKFKQLANIISKSFSCFRWRNCICVNLAARDWFKWITFFQQRPMCFICWFYTRLSKILNLDIFPLFRHKKLSRNYWPCLLASGFSALLCFLTKNQQSFFLRVESCAPNSRLENLSRSFVFSKTIFGISFKLVRVWFCVQIYFTWTGSVFCICKI